ncbi:unnamed protein product [Ilex paraguariensis]|uniref:Uncharacterized protein n=1 Tax=Ilex paraguariensis TaxID=185542 RepID=A0ABC8TWZ1_9AQUA
MHVLLEEQEEVELWEVAEAEELCGPVAKEICEVAEELCGDRGGAIVSILSTEVQLMPNLFATSTTVSRNIHGANFEKRSGRKLSYAEAEELRAIGSILSTEVQSMPNLFATVTKPSRNVDGANFEKAIHPR